MDSVSQNGRRRPRPWTAQDQVTAEVAAACGETFASIGRAISRHPGTVRFKLLKATAGAANLAYQKQWREANREHLQKTSNLYIQANKKRKSAYDKKRYEANRRLFIERARQYRSKNPEQAALCKRNWYTANRQVVAENKRRWRDCNRFALRESIRKRKAIKRASRRAATIPLTLESKQGRFDLWANRCAYCGAVGKMTVDHALALTAGGLDEPSNVVPACSACNCSKNSAPIESWYRRQPFFTEARWRKIQRHCPAAVAGQLPLALPV